MSDDHSGLKHSGAFVVFVLVAIAWSFPLAAHLTTHLPGSAVGDNATFFWNFWWMRTALANRYDFFRTSYLFAPVGADLTLHTHTAFPAFVGATALRSLSVSTALNVTTIGSLALDGFCAYLLSWRVTRRWGAALVGGLIFATSPYLGAHLNGHFNLIAAWPLPLFALVILPALDGLPVASRVSRTGAGIAAGLVLALTAYVDYYYVVFELAMAACVMAVEAGEWSVRSTGRRTSSARLVVVLTAAGVDLAAIVAVTVTGGFAGRVLRIPISMTDTYNPLQLFWILVVAAAALWWKPRLALRRRERWSWARATPGLVALGVTFLAAAAPLVWRGVRLVASGQYVTQQYYWRSAPPGVDAATLVLGNPFHGLWGPAIQRVYGGLGPGINAIEQTAWLGVVPALLAMYAFRLRRVDPAGRRWLAVAAVFMIWALGPHLRIAGHDTGMILPQAFLRYLPVVSNARVPGRAVVVVMLAISVLGAIGAAQWASRFNRPALALFAIAAGVLADFMVAPFPLASAGCPAIYETLRDRPEPGVVAELPVSLGDGLAAVTPIDNHMLLCQAVHRRPLVGGFIARLPPNVVAFYERDPLLRTWLRLSGASGVEDSRAADERAAAERFRADGIAFVMLNRDRASAELRAYVNTLPLTVVAQDGDRTLYAVR